MRTHTLEVTSEEGNVLIAAAVRGLRGCNPMKADRATEDKLIKKLIDFGGVLR